MQSNDDSSVGRIIWELISFRNPRDITAVSIQMGMVVCGILILLGLLYVLFLVIFIIIHHIVYDPDPKAIPDYVKESAQFSSSSDETELEEVTKVE